MLTIDLEFDQRIEKETRKVMSIICQTLPDISQEDWVSRKAAIDQMRKAGNDDYWWYDHLPTSVWTSSMTEEEVARYDAIFEVVEEFIRELHM